MLYNLMVLCFVGLAKFAALVNRKAKLFVEGRKGLLSRLEQTFQGTSGKVIWMHCSSLGEFEQGRPVLEALRQQAPDHKILLTFFSPSGFEVRKKYAGADYIFYLPYDLRSHCRKFISITRPSIALFIKYEFWPNLFQELAKQKIPILSVSSIFRSSQIFFQWYGGSQRKILKEVNRFFVQNRQSVELLRKIGLTNVTHSGDTRFDRVYSITQGKQENFVAKHFKNNQPCWVIGSCWAEDFEIFVHFINTDNGKMKFIIAPHEINEEFMAYMIKSLNVKSVRYSQANAKWEEATVLIIDNIGMLSMLYQYAEFAYVGGGLGKGLHNILEAACFGIPVFFGSKNYERYQEAVDLIAHGGGFAITDFGDLKDQYGKLNANPDVYQLACNASRNYVEMNLGATQKVVSYCLQLLKKP